MRNALMVLSILLCSITSAFGQVSVSIGIPGLSIGINQPVYPTLVLVPGYPVYYDPQVNLNYFFYDGMFWVYQQDNWYASPWYNGPWELVAPEAVPVFILRIPVRYYRYAPAYFQGWSVDASPRWDEHWGAAWAERRRGWDTWDHHSVPPAAPLPAYQRQYSGNRYPSVQQQQVLLRQNYRYQPQDAVTQQYYKAHVMQGASAPAQATPAGVRAQSTQKGGGEVQQSAVAKAPAQERMTQAQRNASARLPTQERRADTRTAVAKPSAEEPRTQTQRAAVAKPPEQEPKTQPQRAAVAKPPEQEPKTQPQRAAVARPPAQEPRTQTQRAAVATPPAQEHRADTQKTAVAKPPAQERKTETERTGASKAPTPQPEARSEAHIVAKAPASEPKERPEEGREQGGGERNR